MTEEVVNTSVNPPVRGFLHRASDFSGDSFVLAHGAGSNCQSKLLVALAEEFSKAGYDVLRIDLPFRQKRPQGPPRRGSSAEDRNGLRRAIELMRSSSAGARGRHRVFLGGNSYGGRQATMLAAEDPALTDGLLLLSYPLHPPKDRSQLRTAHFPALRTPSLFVQGTRDPFGTIEEMKTAIALVPAPNALLEIEGAGHDLLSRAVDNFTGKLPRQILNAWSALTGRDLIDLF